MEAEDALVGEEVSSHTFQDGYIGGEIQFSWIHIFVKLFPEVQIQKVRHIVDHFTFAQHTRATQVVQERVRTRLLRRSC